MAGIAGSRFPGLFGGRAPAAPEGAADIAPPPAPVRRAGFVFGRRKAAEQAELNAAEAELLAVLNAAPGASGNRRGAFPKMDRARTRAALSAFWPKFRAAAGRVPFAEHLAAAWYCWADPKTPAHVRAMLAVALAYFVTPADLIPDFVAGLGYTDDAAVLAATLKLVSVHVKRRHVKAARRLLGREDLPL